MPPGTPRQLRRVPQTASPGARAGLPACCCRELLLKEPALLNLPADEGGDLVVVGDLHGQFHDLQRILLECGIPRPACPRRYLLLGDFIDRGARGQEHACCTPQGVGGQNETLFHAILCRHLTCGKQLTGVQPA